MKMDSRFEVVNSLDPRCQELESLGYTIVGKSWGAHLWLTDPLNLEKYSEKISNLQASGYRVESLPFGFAEQVLELELINNPDYPYTPATAQAIPTYESTKGLWKPGNGIFGAFKEEQLIGVIAASTGSRALNIDFGSVRQNHRRLGVGSAVASLAIITFANLGERHFSTGGAVVNEASQASVKSLGFNVDERWLSYERPNSESLGC
jgi:hypothetical protein